MKIKAGYRIEVVTWENDADNYQTHSWDGLTKEKVIELMKYLKLHKKPYHSDGFGNMYEPQKQQISKYEKALWEIYSNNTSVWDSILGVGEDEVEEDYVLDWFHDCVGYETGVSRGEFFTRVVSSIAVTYTPVDIALQIVTEEFA